MRVKEEGKSKSRILPSTPDLLGFTPKISSDYYKEGGLRCHSLSILDLQQRANRKFGRDLTDPYHLLGATTRSSFVTSQPALSFFTLRLSLSFSVSSFGYELLRGCPVSPVPPWQSVRCFCERLSFPADRIHLSAWSATPSDRVDYRRPLHSGNPRVLSLPSLRHRSLLLARRH